MEDNGVDVVHFESASKVGTTGIISLDGKSTKDEVKATLNDAVYKNNKVNYDVLQSIDYSDWGISVRTPEHYFDAEGIAGTQLRKLGPSDISEDAVFTVGENNKQLNKAELLEFYQKLISENVIDDYNKLTSDFTDIDKLAKIIQDEVKGNDRYSPEIAKACEVITDLDGTKRFALPAYSPIQAQRIQQLLFSIIRSRVTRQKIKGGAAFQVSNYGLIDELQIKFNNDGSIKHIEAYLP